MRLIDADELKKKKRFFHLEEYGEEAVAVEDIDCTPTVDPVKHGKWIYNIDNFTPAYRCSICGYNNPMKAGENIKIEPNNYCSNCGSKMDL